MPQAVPALSPAFAPTPCLRCPKKIRLRAAQAALVISTVPLSDADKFLLGRALNDEARVLTLRLLRLIDGMEMRKLALAIEFLESWPEPAHLLYQWGSLAAIPESHVRFLGLHKRARWEPALRVLPNPE